jgi:dUTP pyrophosphatase
MSHEIPPIPVMVKRLDHFGDLELPDYATAGASGMDVLAAEQVVIPAGGRHAVGTGLAVAVPHGYEIQVRPRSGLALRHGITVPNTPGTIDCDYRGELKVILINHGAQPFEVRRGDRVAQLVLAPVARASWLKVDELEATVRGAGGFGSTGGFARIVEGPVPGTD